MSTGLVVTVCSSSWYESQSIPAESLNKMRLVLHLVKNERLKGAPAKPSCLADASGSGMGYGKQVHFGRNCENCRPHKARGKARYERSPTARDQVWKGGSTNKTLLKELGGGLQARFSDSWLPPSRDATGVT